MFNFFVPENTRNGDKFTVTQGDHNHIRNVLRMKIGDTILINENGISYLCEIIEITENETVVSIIEENYKDTEPEINIYLFQGLPKGDKFELIIQKCVELGVHKIIPTQMKRCVVKIEDKKKAAKVQRWQSIAESAAKQSKRNIIPTVESIMSFNEALEYAENLDMILVPYESENGMKNTLSALKKLKSGLKVGIFIGPEGGFEDSEISAATEKSAHIISLGKRILRTETAAISAVNMCMLYSEFMSESELV